jgi:hypothetical protein
MKFDGMSIGFAIEFRNPMVCQIESGWSTNHWNSHPHFREGNDDPGIKWIPTAMDSVSDRDGAVKYTIASLCFVVFIIVLVVDAKEDDDDDVCCFADMVLVVLCRGTKDGCFPVR